MKDAIQLPDKNLQTYVPQGGLTGSCRSAKEQDNVLWLDHLARDRAHQCWESAGMFNSTGATASQWAVTALLPVRCSSRHGEGLDFRKHYSVHCDVTWTVSSTTKIHYTYHFIFGDMIHD